MNAVVKIGSNQLLLSPGQEFRVSATYPDTKEVVFDQVLLVVDGNNTLIGKPFLPEYKVVCEVIGDSHGPKIRVFKYKAKSRYRKHRGFRTTDTRLKVVNITTSSPQPRPKKPAREIKS